MQEKVLAVCVRARMQECKKRGGQERREPEEEEKKTCLDVINFNLKKKIFIIIFLLPFLLKARIFDAIFYAIGVIIV